MRTRSYLTSPALRPSAGKLMSGFTLKPGPISFNTPASAPQRFNRRSDASQPKASFAQALSIGTHPASAKPLRCELTTLRKPPSELSFVTNTGSTAASPTPEFAPKARRGCWARMPEKSTFSRRYCTLQGPAPPGKPQCCPAASAAIPGGLLPKKTQFFMPKAKGPEGPRN